MITKVEIYNINSINHCVLDFAKAKYKYLENMYFNENLVNPIAIYGINGSGKSSLLGVFRGLVELMINDPDRLNGFINNQIFMSKIIRENDSKASNETVELLSSYIKLYFTLNDDDYVYYIKTFLLKGILEESLLVNNNLVFERNRNEYLYRNMKNKVDSNFFPTLRKLALESTNLKNNVSKAFNFISNIAYVAADRKQYVYKLLNEKGYRDLMVEKSNEVMNILKEYKEFPLYSIIKVGNNKKFEALSYSLRLNVDGDYIDMPLDFISSGMLNQSFLLSILLTLPENGVLIVDELEQALHPTTIKSFIEVVQKKNIQLIFSSHNTHVLQMLRPDQIFFANWRNGFSNYKKLSDIYPNIREVNNIEKMYLSNVFDEDIKE